MYYCNTAHSKYGTKIGHKPTEHKPTVILKIGRFDNMDSAVIIMLTLLMMTANLSCQNVQFLSITVALIFLLIILDMLHYESQIRQKVLELLASFRIFTPKLQSCKQKNILMRKNRTSVTLKTGRFDNIDSAIIISSVSKALQNWNN